ncbi:MAG: hypothetical protein IH849_15965 [Acidobacteria bacterium]|nr:hypothetical protein [Acidobacteriota bacterium]
MSPKSRFPSPLCVPLLLVLAACVSEGGRHEVVDDPQPITSEKAVESFDITWKAIYDTHFDPAFNGVDWLAVKDELRPAAETYTRAVLPARMTKLPTGDGLLHVYFLLGNLYQQQGRMGPARSAYKRALALNEHYEAAERVMSALPALDS